jgi:hypothetical protein
MTNGRNVARIAIYSGLGFGMALGHALDAGKRGMIPRK